MKKILAILLALVMVLSMAACGAKQEAAAPVAPEAPKEEAAAPAAPETPEEEAPAVEEGPSQYALEAQAAANAYANETFFDNSENYKDFNADGKLKVAFVCKFLTSVWFAPKSEAMQAKADEYGIEYIGIDANSSEDQFMQGLQNALNQQVDVVILTPVDANMLPACVEMCQEAGVAYLTTDDGGYDFDGNRVPHLGLDDYGLCYGAGKAMAAEAVARGFDPASLKIVMLDAPASDSIHRRSLGAYQALMDGIPGLTDANFEWVDTVDGGTDNCVNKFSGTFQAIAADAKYIMAFCGGSPVWDATFPIFDENNFDYNNAIVGGACNNDTIAAAMAGSPEKAKAIYCAGIMAAPSGEALIELCNDLFQNGTKFPDFTGYPEYIVSSANIDQWLSDIGAK